MCLSGKTAFVLNSTFALNRSDPVRPFISGHVANSMAAEVIALLHSLLTAPESNTAQIWTSTAEKVNCVSVFITIMVVDHYLLLTIGLLIIKNH